MERATLTLSVPAKLKQEMRQLKGVNWSEETRKFLQERIARLKALQRLDELTKNSRLTEADVLEIGDKIKREIAKRHGLGV